MTIQRTAGKGSGLFLNGSFSNSSVESAIGAESRSELEPSSCFERQYEELPVLPTG